MQYTSNELHDMLKMPKFNNALAGDGKKIEFHVDPGDLGEINVRIPHESDRILRVPVAPKWTKYATGLSLWHHKRIKEFIAADARKDAEQLLQAKYELMTLMRQTGWDKKGSLRARGIVTRMEGAHRNTRAGTSTGTGVIQAPPDHPETLWSQADSTAKTPASRPKKANADETLVPDRQIDKLEDSANNINGLANRRLERTGYRP